MKSTLKNLARSILLFLRIDLTKNLEYDRLTQAIMKKVIRTDMGCIDVGCHKGEMLDLMLKYAPSGQHFAFEPIPDMYQALVKKYEGKARISPYALSDHSGETTFHFVKNAPAYSGIQKRKYDVDTPEIEEIKVELKTLDAIIPENTAIGFIKIDVEGGEYAVLKGAQVLIQKNKPIIIFECGLGASEFYGTKPDLFFEYLRDTCALNLSTLRQFINNKPALTQAEFVHLYNTNREYYFIAYP